MSLTVPRGGTFAGRAPEIRIAAPDYGDTLAQFGDLVQEKAARMQDAQRQITQRRTHLDITRDLGQARLELEQYSDPEAIDQDWPQRVADIRKKYLEPGPDGQPRYDAETGAALDLVLTELSDRHALALGGKAIGLRQSQQDAEWVTLQADISAQALSADPETLEAILEVGEAEIDSRLDRGTISPEQAAQEKVTFRQGIYSGRANQLAADDPAAFLTAADAGEYDVLGAEELSRRRVAAQGELTRRAAAETKAAEAALKAQNTAISKRLVDMTGLMSEGFKVTDEDFLNDPQVQQSPDYPAARAAQTLRDEQPGIRMMTVGELDAQIAAEMARPVAHQYQTERVKVLKTWRDEAATRGNTDFVAMAQDARMSVPELPAFDPANPAPFAQGLEARIGFDAWATEKGHTRTQAIVSVAEKAALKPVLDPKADPTAKVALARSMLAASGGKTDRLATVLEIDPVFARATRLLGSTRNSALAEEMLRGQQKDALGTVSLPTDKALGTAFDAITAGAFDANPKAKAEVFAAARALYADSATSIDPDEAAAAGLGDGETDMFSAAVQRVLGATSDPSGALSIGGLQRLNDQPVYLPPGVSVDQLESTWDDLGKQLRGMVRMDLYGTRDFGFPGDSATAPDRLRALTAASINQTAPDLGKDPAARWASVTPQRVGESNVYELRYTHNGRSYTVPEVGDQLGRAWRFTLSDLMREAAK